LEPTFLGTDYYNAFDEALPALNLMSNRFKPLMAVITDWESAGPEKKYLDKF
jgi:hypothetical protein